MEFIENEFVPSNPILVSLKDKIVKKGLGFHPYLVTSAINVEVERQLKTLIENTFKDMNIEQLGACSKEVTEYANAEEARILAEDPFAQAIEVSEDDINYVTKDDIVEFKESDDVIKADVDVKVPWK